MAAAIEEGFPSGQRDQTVNLTAPPSKVRILLPPPFAYNLKRHESEIVEGFPSGQRDQTVNLTAPPSKVRILLPPPSFTLMSGSKYVEGFPSGQRDQTVNLTAPPSKVRILLPPPFLLYSFSQSPSVLSTSTAFNSITINYLACGCT